MQRKFICSTIYSVEDNNSEKQSLKGPLVLLKEAWGVYKRNALTYIVLLLLSFVGSIAGVAVLILSGVVGYAVSQNWAVTVLAAVLVGLPVLIYFQLLFYLSLVKALLADSEGAKTTIKQSLSGTRSLIIPYFATQLLSTLIVLGGSMLFLLPGIIISVWFSLYTFVFLSEGKRGMMALLTSREYVRNYFAVVILYPILFAILTSVPLYVVSWVLEEMDASLLNSLLNLVFSLIITPLTTLFLIGIYKDLKRIKGEVTIENFASRKTKYIAIGVLGALVMVGLIVLFTTLVVPAFREIYEGMSDSPGVIDEQQLEDIYLPETV